MFQVLMQLVQCHLQTGLWVGILHDSSNFGLHMYPCFMPLMYINNQRVDKQNYLCYCTFQEMLHFSDLHIEETQLPVRCCFALLNQMHFESQEKISTVGFYIFCTSQLILCLNMLSAVEYLQKLACSLFCTFIKDALDACVNDSFKIL